MPDEDLEILISDLEMAESIEDIQTHILFANEWLEQEEDFKLAGQEEDHRNRLIDKLRTWLNKLKDKLDQMAGSQGATTYTISVSGGFPSPSISLEMTYETVTE